MTITPSEYSAFGQVVAEPDRPRAPSVAPKKMRADDVCRRFKWLTSDGQPDLDKINSARGTGLGFPPTEKYDQMRGSGGQITQYLAYYDVALLDTWVENMKRLINIR
jgi:hypothetical protein